MKNPFAYSHTSSHASAVNIAYFACEIIRNGKFVMSVKDIEEMAYKCEPASHVQYMASNKTINPFSSVFSGYKRLNSTVVMANGNRIKFNDIFELVKKEKPLCNEYAKYYGRNIYKINTDNVIKYFMGETLALSTAPTVRSPSNKSRIVDMNNSRIVALFKKAFESGYTKQTIDDLVLSAWNEYRSDKTAKVVADVEKLAEEHGLTVEQIRLMITK